MSTFFTNDSYCNHLDYIDEEVSRRKFYEYLSQFDIDMSEIFETGKSCDKNKKQQFNVILRKIKAEHSVDIYESVIFIEQDFAEINFILKMLDDRNWAGIKKELSVKYGKEIKNNKLLKFFVK